jgi:hypothetical protein
VEKQPSLKRTCLLGLLLIQPVAAGDVDWESLPLTSHKALQAVDDSGAGTHPLDGPLKVRGVILNRYDLMLDPTASAPGFIGGSWQIYVQTIDAGDFGGTACWMGQNYGSFPFNPPDETYTDAAWNAEVERVTHDPAGGHAFQVGDLVEVHARAPGLSYRGKVNINEQHLKDPEFDFDVILLEADRGLPTPEVLSLSDLKDASDKFIFDPTRQTGCERHQGTLVRVKEVSLVGDEWASGGTYTISDGAGRTFPILLSRGAGFDTWSPPSEPFELVALLDQEDATSGGVAGYRFWVLRDYDGNGFTVGGPSGDFNGDGALDDVDFAALAECVSGPEAAPASVSFGVQACREAFDFDMDRDVDLVDFAEFQRVFGG